MRKNYLNIVFSIIISFFYLLVISTTSPLWEQSHYGDSLIFQLIGKYWVHGYTPYIYLWDHKGPLIFFLNAVGYFITNTKEGVFIVQLIFMSFTVRIALSFFSLSMNQRTSAVLTIVMLISMTPIYQSNSTEEYCLPFLFYCIKSLYIWSTHNIESKSFLSHSDSFIFGFSTAFAFLTRATNALSICTGILVVGIVLLLKKKYSELFKMTGLYIVGFISLTLPFLIYFALNGALYDMWYGTIIYNILYAAAPVEASYTILSLIWLMALYAASPILAIIGIYQIFVGHLKKGWLYVFMGSITFTWFVKSALFAHYAMIAMPFFCIISLELYEFVKISHSKIIKFTSRTLFSGYLICNLFLGLYTAIPIYVLKLPEHSLDNQAIKANEYDRAKKLISLIPEDEMHGLITYNVSTGVYIYLSEDILPVNRFYFSQDWWCRHGDENFRRNLVSSFESADALWILLSVNDEAPPAIADILSEKYEEYKNLPSDIPGGKTLVLYKRKQILF
ncbi:MAG: hypothetical protein IJ608_04130 [Lachnospiraceae bacterium]|nr:hypothetical protein [Lachnospiraceae bacterium]